MFAVVLHPLAHRELESLDARVRKEVRKKLRELGQFPERDKRLTGSPFRSLRIGDYRAIYEVRAREQRVIVLFVAHRKRVYADFAKLF